jgi:hypothetical protein
MCRDVLGSLGIAGICTDVLGCVGMCWDVWGCVGMCRDM